MSIGSSQRVRLWMAGTVFSALAFACAAVPETESPDCDSGKCDDPRGQPTTHSAAVLLCDKELDEGLADAGALVDAQLASHQRHRACVAVANNGAATVIEGNLASSDAPIRSLDEISIVFDEFRYASLCVDLEAASTLVGDEKSLLSARCESIRERTLAELIGALVRFGSAGTGWLLQPDSESFSECYSDFADALSSGGDLYAAHARLAVCATEELVALAPALKDSYCAQTSCTDDLVALSFIAAGFETAITTSDRACQMLVDASEVREELGTALIDCRMVAYSKLYRNVLDVIEP